MRKSVPTAIEPQLVNSVSDKQCILMNFKYLTSLCY
jgi:hypothetical protein